MLNRLLAEHDHIRRTLNLLEMQFLDLCRGKSPDLSIMRSIIVYIQEYPEMTHHPLEDVIFSLLLKRVDDTKLIQQLIADHNDLEVVTRKLRHTLTKFEKDSSLLNELNHQLSIFISRQRQHMYIEEIEVYPLIEQLIKPADWEHAETIIQLKDDPVFGARTQNDYETLYREIESRSQ